MKVLLRNIETGKYYAGPHRWVIGASRAHDFHQVESAIHLALEENLTGTELVITYSSTGSEVVLPMKGHQAAGHGKNPSSQ